MTNTGLAIALAVCSLMAGAALAGEETIRLEDGAGRDVTAARCSSCHSLDYIGMVAPAMNRAAWEKSVRKMIDAFGAPVDEQDARQIVDYLAEHYSAGAATK
jgi:cytochrome c5